MRIGADYPNGCDTNIRIMSAASTEDCSGRAASMLLCLQDRTAILLSG